MLVSSRGVWRMYRTETSQTSEESRRIRARVSKRRRLQTRQRRRLKRRFRRRTSCGWSCCVFQGGQKQVANARSHSGPPSLRSIVIGWMQGAYGCWASRAFSHTYLYIALAVCPQMCTHNVAFLVRLHVHHAPQEPSINVQRLRSGTNRSSACGRSGLTRLPAHTLY